METKLDAYRANKLLDILIKASHEVPDGGFTTLEELDIAEALTKARLIVSNSILRTKRR